MVDTTTSSRGGKGELIIDTNTAGRKADRHGTWQEAPGERHERLGEVLASWKIPYRSLYPYSEAFTHASYVHEASHELRHNERLEFLGDAVLELVVSSHLFARFKDLPEGNLTRMRAAIVCAPTLARIAGHLGLAAHVLMGRGEEESGGRERSGLLADVFEAFIGAIYIDAGFEVARDFILEQLHDELAALDQRGYYLDAKGRLQSWYQKGLIGEVRYELVGEEGPDHAKWFTIEVIVDGKPWARAEAGTKKEAEKEAARLAVKRLIARDAVDEADNA